MIAQGIYHPCSKAARAFSNPKTATYIERGQRQKVFPQIANLKVKEQDEKETKENTAQDAEI